MTHDELLEILEHTAQDGMADEPILKALRAVVKLHESFDFTWGGEPLTSCKCGEMSPCSTIQAIEKELQ